jgi:hypothetical protein
VSRFTRLARPAAAALAGAGACALALYLAGWRPPPPPPESQPGSAPSSLPEPDTGPAPATVVRKPGDLTAVVAGEVVTVVPVPAEFHPPTPDGKPLIIHVGDRPSDEPTGGTWAQGTTRAVVLRRGATSIVCFFPDGVADQVEPGDTVAIRGLATGGWVNQLCVVNGTLLARQPRGTPAP